jgi:CRISPR-associated endonuclease Csy4
MNHYTQITLRPTIIIKPNVLLNNVFVQLHQALVNMKSEDIGVSFPKCHLSLGNVIRIHGTKERLLELAELEWLGDYKVLCDILETAPIPKETKHRRFSRIQPKSMAKLRRYVKNGKIPKEEIGQQKRKILSQGIDNPFLDLDSKSTGENYRLFVRIDDPIDTPTLGKFNTFGISKEGTTVPWF